MELGWLSSQGLGKAPGRLLRVSEWEWKSRHEHSNFVAGKDLGAGVSKLVFLSLSCPVPNVSASCSPPTVIATNTIFIIT